MKKLFLVIIIPFISFGQIVTEDCSSIPDPGPCFGCGFIYWFNPTTSQCEESCWGLCDGLVPFWTLEDCQNSCENNFLLKFDTSFLGENSQKVCLRLEIYTSSSIEKKYYIKQTPLSGTFF